MLQHWMSVSDPSIITRSYFWFFRKWCEMNWFSHPSLLLRNGYYLNAFVLKSVGDYLSTCTCVHKRLKCLPCGFEREERLWNVCFILPPKSLGLPASHHTHLLKSCGVYSIRIVKLTFVLVTAIHNKIPQFYENIKGVWIMPLSSNFSGK